MKLLTILALLPSLTIAADLIVPTGTPISITLSHPIWMNSAQIGDSLNGTVNFPVVSNNQIAIPPSAAVHGSLDIINRPTRLNPSAQIRAHFTTIILPNGEVAELNAQDDHQASIATFSLGVTASNDLLLDNGTQLTFTLGQPVTIRTATSTVPFHAVPTSQSASRCQTIPGTPGTAPTVIPGTAPTPPTVIPQGPDFPPIVIPGSPGTPDTLIGGTDATPDIPCPPPPRVTSALPQFVQTLEAAKPFAIQGVPFSKGAYRISWTGLGPFTQVTLQKTKATPRFFTAYIQGAPGPAYITHPTFGPTTAGPPQLKSVQFKGQAFTLDFTSHE